MGPWGQVLPQQVLNETSVEVQKIEDVQEIQEVVQGENEEAAGHQLSKSASADSAVEATEEVLEQQTTAEEEKENLGEAAGLCKSKADCDIQKISESPLNGEEVLDRRSFAEISIQ